jgi:hypothetical protein
MRGVGGSRCPETGCVAIIFSAGFVIIISMIFY